MKKMILLVLMMLIFCGCSSLAIADCGSDCASSCSDKIGKAYEECVYDCIIDCLENDPPPVPDAPAPTQDD